MKEYTFSYVFCSGLLQSWYELCGWGGFCCLSFLGCVEGRVWILGVYMNDIMNIMH